jgi:hypothetical protein
MASQLTAPTARVICAIAVGILVAQHDHTLCITPHRADAVAAAASVACAVVATILLQLSPDQRRGLRKFLLATTSCPQPERAATFAGVQYPLLCDSQEGGAEEVVEALCTLAGLPAAT